MKTVKKKKRNKNHKIENPPPDFSDLLRARHSRSPIYRSPLDDLKMSLLMMKKEVHICTTTVMIGSAKSSKYRTSFYLLFRLFPISSSSCLFIIHNAVALSPLLLSVPPPQSPKVIVVSSIPSSSLRRRPRNVRVPSALSVSLQMGKGEKRSLSIYSAFLRQQRHCRRRPLSTLLVCVTTILVVQQNTNPLSRVAIVTL